jgi:hypothetical protein
MEQRRLRGTVAAIRTDTGETLENVYIVALQEADHQFCEGAWLELDKDITTSTYWSWRFTHHAVEFDVLPEWAQRMYYEALLSDD